MPHGSGGGSHGGGSHHSSSHHSSSHGGSRGPRMSRRPFPHARRYRYYDRRGMAHYVYADTPPRRKSLMSLILNLLFLVPFIIAGAMVTSSVIDEFIPPRPLTQDYISSDVYIEDNADIFQDTSQLDESLRSFKQQTGISPYIITVYDSDWKGKYTSLENYAYSLYVNRFPDEKHFLIVYSEPENADELDFVDWSWEGMQGDDTDPIITTKNFSIFQSDLQRYLTTDSMSTEEAFATAFNNTESYIMSASPDYNSVFSLTIFALIWNVFILVFLISMVRSYINSRRIYEEVPPDNNYPPINNNYYNGGMGGY